MLNGERVFNENALLKGDFEVIVSGQRKGTGSSRETAAQCEKWAGIKIVIDCANGAGYKSGPHLLKSLGAKVISIGVNPNGMNINEKCGSTFPKKIQLAVKKHRAHLGISLDGDADRIIMCDEKGKIIDGDQIIAALAKRWKNKKMLRGV